MSLFTQPVKDYIMKKDRRPGGGEAEKGDKSDSNAAGGATNAGAFVLRKAIKERSEMLKKDSLRSEKDEKSHRVPDSFFKFIGYSDKGQKHTESNTDAYYNFLEALLEYCRELFRLENKQ